MLNLVQQLITVKKYIFFFPRINKLINDRGNCFPDAPVVSTRQEYMVKAMHDFISSHKFYLAFENTHKCKDYITEKLHRNCFIRGTVPIVYGARKVVKNI